MDENINSKFDVAQRIVKLRGNDYLETKWRLVWLRTDAPNAQIVTEMVHFDPDNKMAVFKAFISIPGGGSATGFGSETSDDFKDYLEKAETKALGRALAALGFGTAFAQELDFDNQDVTNPRVVDSPVKNRDTSARQTFNAPARPTPQTQYPQNNVTPAANPVGLTAKQLAYIYASGKSTGRKDEQVETFCREKFNGKKPSELTKSEATRLIDLMKAPA